MAFQSPEIIGRGAARSDMAVCDGRAKRIGAGLLLLIVCFLVGVSPASALGRVLLDVQSTPAEEQQRYRQALNELLQRTIRPALSSPEWRTAARIRLTLPAPKPGDRSLAFRAYRYGGRPYVSLPVASLKLVEDISIAYAWLQENGYGTQSIDVLASSLERAWEDAVAKGRFPAPLSSFGIPADALADPSVNEASTRLRDTAYTFILLHELGHVTLGHTDRGMSDVDAADERDRAADAFALDVLERTGTAAEGALAYFQFQVHAAPMTSPSKSSQIISQGRLVPARMNAMAQTLNRASFRQSAPAQRDTMRRVATRFAELGKLLERRASEAPPEHFQLADRAVSRAVSDVASESTTAEGTGAPVGIGLVTGAQGGFFISN